MARSARGLSVSTLADVLQLLRPRVSPGLVGDDGWRRLLARARGLPSAAATSGFALEIRCGSPEPAVDLCLLTAPGCPVSRHLIARGEAEDADPAAIALGALFQAAERGDRAVGVLSLEFDLVEGTPHDASPGVFVSPPEYRDNVSAGYTEPDRPMAALVAAGCPEHAGNRRALETVCAALPPGASLSQVGLFPAREPQIVRIIVAGAENADIPAFLRRSGWPGTPGPVVECLSAFRGLASYFRFAFDMHEGRIAPRLGLEMFQPVARRRLGGDPDTWLRFIDRLAERRLCRHDKAAGLRAWQGWEPVFDKTGAFTAHRSIHHVKFDVREDGIGARAYIFVLFGAPLGRFGLSVSPRPADKGAVSSTGAPSSARRSSGVVRPEGLPTHQAAKGALDSGQLGVSAHLRHLAALQHIDSVRPLQGR